MYSNNERINQLEKPGIDAFRKYCENNTHILNYKFTVGNKALDCIIQTDDFRTIGVEIKHRNFPSNKYNTLIYEVSKDKGIKNRYKKESSIDLGVPIFCSDIIYVNHFEDEVMFVYNYSDIYTKITNGTYKIETKWMNKATFMNNSKTEKEIFMLPTKDAKKIIMLNNVKLC